MSMIVAFCVKQQLLNHRYFCVDSVSTDILWFRSCLLLK